MRPTPRQSLDGVMIDISSRRPRRVHVRHLARDQRDRPRSPRSRSRLEMKDDWAAAARAVRATGRGPFDAKHGEIKNRRVRHPTPRNPRSEVHLEAMCVCDRSTQGTATATLGRCHSSSSRALPTKPTTSRLAAAGERAAVLMRRPPAPQTRRFSTIGTTLEAAAAKLAAQRAAAAHATRRVAPARGAASA